MNLPGRLKTYYQKIVNGIGFLPSIITVGITLLALGLNFLQQTDAGEDILTTINFIQFKEAETVRALLAALLAATISLTVFSFSMVMVVVNQASSNYSPKVTEGFINSKGNQTILGIYIGTILFLIISLIRVDGTDDLTEVPHFNVFTSIILITVCIALFILFIQNISNSVRINNVAKIIYTRTKNVLQKSSDSQSDGKHDDGQQWHVYTANNSGYFQNLSEKRLLRILKKENLFLKVIPYYGTYLHSKNDMFCLNRKVEDKEILEKIRNTFNMHSGENIEENYFYGFRQLREVGVKALSPGINDPGIAVICLDYLTELLALYIDHEKRISLKDSKSDAGIYFRRHDFRDMLNLTFSPLESYGKRDYIILGHILKCLEIISLYDRTGEHRDSLMAHARTVLAIAEDNINIPMQRKQINEVVNELNERDYFDLTPLDDSMEREGRYSH